MRVRILPQDLTAMHSQQLLVFLLLLCYSTDGSMDGSTSGTDGSTDTQVTPVITFPMNSQNYTVNEFHPVTFTCNATGIPPPEINWYRNGTLLNNTYDPRITLSECTDPEPFSTPGGYICLVSRTLTLDNTIDENSGTYTCVASNGVMPEDRQDFELVVYVAPNITEPPVDLVVVQPENATFSCQATGRPRPDISWFRQERDTRDAEISNGVDILIEEQPMGEREIISNLTIVETQPSDAGQYVCVSVSDVEGLEPADELANLTVHVIPNITFVVDGMNYTVNEFNPVTFTCNATGIPPPEINWYRNDTLLNNANDPRITLSERTDPEPFSTPGGYIHLVSRTLTLDNTIDEDSGTYTCVASNGVMPEDRQDFELIVYVAPAILVPPVDLVVVQPENATFSCQATGRPRPRIDWGRVFESSDDPLELSQGENEIIIEDQPMGEREIMSTLTIVETQPSDAGQYVCGAISDVGGLDPAFAQANLTVHVTPMITFPMDGMNYTVDEFNPVTFTCNATGIPQPEINWYRNGTLLNNANDPRITLSECTDPEPFSTPGGYICLVSRTLTLDNTIDEDSGTYTCVASNGVMPADRQDFELIVYVAPNITQPPVDLVVVQPENATFSCQATGRPRPDISWFRQERDTRVAEISNGVDILIEEQPIGEREIISNLTIVETQPSDTGQYVCVAMSDVEGLEPADELANLTVHVIPNITFVVDGMNYTVNEFNPVTFTCNATGIPPPEINWYRNDTLLNNTYDPRITLSERTDPEPFSTPGGYIHLVSQNLTLDNTMDEDSGTYTCVASNGVMPEDRQDFELVVYVAPNITQPPLDLVVVQPENSTFSCWATGRPRPGINWFRQERDTRVAEISNGVDILIEEQPMGEREIISNLTIVETQPSDTGQYVCVAMSDVEGLEPADELANLTVHVIPNITFVVDGMNYTVNEFNPVTFTCNATGIPPPEINCYRNGTPLNSANNPRITLSKRTDPEPFSTPGGYIHLVSQNLTLDNTMDEDSGTYTCVVSNGNKVMPEDRQDFELVVYVAPNITQPPLDLVVVQPENSTFSCRATGRPRPGINWFRQERDTRVAEISNGVDILIEEQPMGEREIISNLTIVESVPMNADEYTCKAENIVTANTATATLTVYVIPEIQFPGEDFTYFVNESNSVNFSCSATGIPAPTIQWFRDGELLNGINVNPGVENLNSRIVLEDPDEMEYPLPDGDGNVTLTSRMLTIYNTTGTDNGTYTCEASNGVVRNDTQDFELFVQIPPLVVALPEDQMVIGNETVEVTLEFEIRNADPPVEQDGLRWFYCPRDEIDLDLSLFNGEEITNLMNRTSQSMLMFSDLANNNTFVSLTVSNTVQGRANGGESDEGRYFFVAFNPAGYSSSYIDLIIFAPPTIQFPPEDQFVIDGNISVFQCESFAFPNHTIIWTFINNDGDANTIISTADANNSTKYSIIREREPPDQLGMLTISDVQYGDRGSYNCTARNTIGEESQAATLTVHVTPAVNDTSDLTEVNISLPATLVCLATGYPRPDITWQKNGEDFMAMGDTRIDIFQFDTVSENASSGYESSGYMVSGGGIIEELVMRAGLTQEDVAGLGELGVVGVLTFEGVVREDTANYTCTATNALEQTMTLQAESPLIPLVVLERPDPPENISVVEFRARWVLLQWIAGFDGNRPIQRFRIYENNLNKSAGFTRTGYKSPKEVQVAMEENIFHFNISSVVPFSDYIFTVQACNELNCSDLENGSTSDQIRTEEDVPERSPENIQAFSPSPTSIQVSWDPPPKEFRNGIITGYRINYTATLIPTIGCENPDPMPPAGEEITTNTSFTLNNLAIYANYSIMVSAGTRVGFGPPSQPAVQVLTLNDTSSAPTNVMIDTVEMTELTLSWSCPETPNGMIAYMVYYQGMKDYETEGFVSEPLTATTMGDDQTITLTQLFPDTIYTISVSALSPAGEGERSMEVTGRTVPAPPPILAPPMVPEEQTGGPRAITICFTRPATINGRISHYHTVAIRLSSSDNPLSHPDTDYNSFQSLQQNSYSDINCGSTPSGPQAYIAAEFADSLFGDGCFTFGDENKREDRNYTNDPLCFSSFYTFFMRAYTEVQNSTNRTVGPIRQTDWQYDLFSSTNYTPVQKTGVPPEDGLLVVTIAAGGVGIAVIIIIIIGIIIIIMFLAWRLRSYCMHTTSTLEPDLDAKPTEYQPPDGGSVTRPLIPLAAFATHIEHMHINENCGFSEEFKMIEQNSPEHSAEASTAPDNKPRNRYVNIHCFDHSRVHLHPVEGFGNDYINANFIDGYNRRNEYIATQGPLLDTVGDFWRMIWDYNVTTIVMLTNLVEKMKVKCTQYWPNSGSQQYANIIVTVTNVVTHADFIIRLFVITAAHSYKSKQIWQYHFISWPDYGVPRHATPLLYFLSRVRSTHPPSCPHPITIHCSAGVGRTGSLICIDVELQRARQEGVVDPFNFALHMRQARNYMVQTEDQYVFLHNAILEAVFSGNTEVTVEKLSQKMSELEDIDIDGESGYQKEFDCLRQFRVNVSEFTDANDDANKFKNRLANALPFNYNRVCLLKSPGVSGSDYINASYIDSYSRKHAYIATQGPLENTIEDFWRMIWEKESHVIVMLTQLSVKGKEQCARYWPDSLNSPEKIGSLTIEVLSENKSEEYITREIKVSHTTSTVSNSRVVCQFQFMAWPEHGAPASGAAMIGLIDQITRKQRQTGNMSVVVHCSAGIGRTGVFCALSVAIERVKSEGIADVFHTVKHLRTQRPHMVQTVDQYIFCYCVIREYASTYSQFPVPVQL